MPITFKSLYLQAYIYINTDCLFELHLNASSYNYYCRGLKKLKVKYKNEPNQVNDNFEFDLNFQGLMGRDELFFLMPINLIVCVCVFCLIAI